MIEALLGAFGWGKRIQMEAVKMNLTFVDVSYEYPECHGSICWINEEKESVFFMYNEQKGNANGTYRIGVVQKDIDRFKAEAFDKIITYKMMPNTWQLSIVQEINLIKDQINIFLPKSLDNDMNLKFQSQELANQWFKVLLEKLSIEKNRKKQELAMLIKHKDILNLEKNGRDKQQQKQDQKEEVESTQKTKVQVMDCSYQSKKEEIEKIEDLKQDNKEEAKTIEDFEQKKKEQTQQQEEMKTQVQDLHKEEKEQQVREQDEENIQLQVQEDEIQLKDILKQSEYKQKQEKMDEEVKNETQFRFTQFLQSMANQSAPSIDQSILSFLKTQSQ